MKVVSNNQDTLSASFSLGKILCFVAVIWTMLLYPVAQYHTSLLAFGFSALNIENQFYEACSLLIIGIAAHKLFPNIKIEITRSIFYAEAVYMLPTISFLISVNELAILLYLVLFLPIMFGIGNFAKGYSDFKLQILAIGVYTAQVVIFFLIFSLFFQGAENLIMSSLLWVTHVISIFTVVIELFACANLIVKGKNRVRSEYIFNRTLIICILISVCLLIFKGAVSNQLFIFAFSSVCGWIFFKMCNYSKNKPNKKQGESRENKGNNFV